MTPFEAYTMFLAVKAHFTRPSYDYFKYHGKVNADHRSFEQRRDKFHFYKLSKHKDLLGFLVANFVDSNPKWVGDLIGDQPNAIYTEWLKRQQAITYTVSQDIDSLDDHIKQSVIVEDGAQYPKLFVMYRQNKICLETMVSLNKLLSFFTYWDKKVNDPIIWPSVRNKILKYEPFVKIDYDKVKKIVKASLIREETI